MIETVEENGRPVHEIRRLNVAEVSVATSGANPSACCWLGDEAADELPAEIADARARWAVGRAGAVPRRPPGQAEARGKPSAT